MLMILKTRGKTLKGEKFKAEMKEKAYLQNKKINKAKS